MGFLFNIEFPETAKYRVQLSLSSQYRIDFIVLGFQNNSSTRLCQKSGPKMPPLAHFNTAALAALVAS